MPIAKTLLLKNGTGGFKPDELKQLVEKCELREYIILPSPNKKLKNLERWLNKPLQEKSAISNFLGLDNGDKTVVEQWIVQSVSISTWVDAIRLAKALRNATAHGALSPTKVQEWGLREVFLTLPDNLAEIVVASLQKLTSHKVC